MCIFFLFGCVFFFISWVSWFCQFFWKGLVGQEWEEFWGGSEREGGREKGWFCRVRSQVRILFSLLGRFYGFFFGRIGCLGINELFMRIFCLLYRGLGSLRFGFGELLLFFMGLVEFYRSFCDLGLCVICVFLVLDIGIGFWILQFFVYSRIFYG